MKVENIEEIYRLTPIQQELLRRELKSSDSSPVRLCVFTLDGDLSVAAFKQSWQSILLQHQALRSLFYWEGINEPVQVVPRQVSLPLQQHDWSTLPADEQARHIEQFLTAEYGHKFDPSKSPLFRIHLIRLAKEKYLFVWNYHRLLLDRASQQILLTDLFARYDAICEMREFELNPAYFYKDYFGWLKEQDLTGAEAFWIDALQGLHAPASPGSNPYNPSQVQKEETELSLNASAALRSLAQRHRLNTKTIISGAWALLLGRYLDSAEIVFGMSTSGRPSSWPAGEFAVGAFSNLVPFRVEIITDATVLLWLKQLQDRYQKILQFEHVAPVTIEGWCGMEPDQTLFENALVFNDVDHNLVSQWESAGIKMRRRSVDIDHDYPTVLEVSEPSQFVLRLAHDCSTFQRESVGRILGYLKTLLETIIAYSERPLANLSLLTEQEQRQLLVAGDGVGSIAPLKCSLSEIFEAQVDRAPEKIAIMFGDEVIDYYDLNERANQLARHLCRLGVGPEVTVGVCANRSIMTVVALLGILKAGGVYVPLDPKSPQERLSYMLADTRASVLLTEQHLIFNLPVLAAVSEIVCLDSDWPEIAEQSTENLRPCVAGMNLAYVIYTSGSTGGPKGVCVSYESAANHLMYIRESFDLRANDCMLQFASLSFDVSIEQTLATFFSGATLALRDEYHWSAANFYPRMKRYGITVVNLPPAYWNLLAQENHTAEQLGIDKQIRLVIIGGDAMPVSAVRQWQQSAIGVSRLLNAYGPTETTITSTLFDVPPHYCEQEPVIRVPIGRPVAGRAVYVLDRQGNIRPPGTEGELCIGGPLLARGYLNDPERTAEKFVPDAWGALPGGRLYRTGDLACFQSNKQIEFLGRLDTQVKIRGFRIELAEIETMLCQSPTIKEAAVVDREDAAGDKQLIAYVVPHELDWEGEASIDALREALKERLPDYMIPAAFIRIDELPVTPSGKVDRRALASATQTFARQDDHYVSPRTPVEEMLVGIFKEVLKLDQVDVRDNFFEIGGHSLLATQVVSRARSIFGVEIGVGSIFEEATVEGLARRIEEAMKAGRKHHAAPPLVRVSRERSLPVSFAQQRLWFIQQLGPGNTIYNSAGAARLEGKLNLEILEKVINEIVRRHEVLRTRIEVEKGEAMQVIDEWRPLRLEVNDLKSLPLEEREENVRRIASEEASAVFDLSRGPLLRVKVLELEEDDHILLFTMPHIVSDGWSVGILIREVGQLHQAFSAGKPSPLKELPIQYADFAVWQRQWLKGEVLEHDLEYWRKQLQGMEDLELPINHPRPAVTSYRAARYQFVVETEVAEKLRELGGREGATLFMMLLGGFGVVMSRYSRQEDVALGTDIANRNRAEIEGLIGFFVNQLVLRLRVNPPENFKELLKRVREVCLGAYAHQNLPFEKLVEELQPERNLRRSPLFQAKLILQNTPRIILELKGARLKSLLESEAHTAGVDLAVAITDTGRDLVGTVGYSRDLFDAETIERLISHYANVLRGIVDCERPVCELSLLSDQERAQIVVEWNQTERPYPQAQCIHDLFREQADRRPDQVALIGEQGQMSYRELNRRANRLGCYLQNRGVGPEVVVGLCVERSIEMVVAVLGVLKAGGAYLPLDPGYPLERLSYMIEDARIGIVLTEARLEERLPVSWGQTICLDQEREQIGEHSEKEPESEVGGENLAYLIYTSGSTGKPKGVMVAHRGLCNLVEAQKRAFGMDSAADHSRVLQFASLSFDASVWEIFGALAAGGSLHVYARESLIPGDDFARILREDQITTVTLPPTILAALEQAKLFHLQTIVSAGEACSTEIVERWAGKRRFLNAYGPTEGTVCASIGVCEAGSDRSPTIGRPVANTRLYILDREMNPVPVRARGDIYMAGVGLARGYLGKPELTAERFIPNLFSQEDGARLYRTGDVGRYLSDGEIEFIGRADEQVKIHGHRIEPGEIETALGEQPGVRQVAVITREDEPGRKRLVAYVVADSAAESKETAQLFGGESAVEIGGHQVAKDLSVELRRALESRLPNYMVPSAIVLLDRLPLTSNGKLDRQALPAPEFGHTEIQNGYADARTPVEEIVVGIFKEVLDLDRVGVHDNFFEVGGHSLLATRVISRVRNTFGVEIEVGSMFEKPTVAGLAGRIAEAMRAGEKNEAPPLVRVEREGPEVRLPLSFAQQRLWFLDQLAPNTSSNNVPGAVRLKGPLNVAALEHSITEIVRRHESLRTRFVTLLGQPKQVIDPPARWNLPVEDLSDLPEARREAEVKLRAAEHAKHTFDLSRGRLLRTKLLRMGIEEHVLLVTMHHIISDGWSIGVLISELAALYGAFCRQQPSQLAELPIQFGDYALWQRERLQGDAIERLMTYWVRHLDGAPRFLELPADRPRLAKQNFRGALYPTTLSDDLTEAVKDLSRREDVTLFMTLLAAFNVLLHHATKLEDIIVGTDVANRSHVETERLIGFFVNQIVLRTSLTDAPTFREILQRVRAVTLGAYAHQDMPFDKLVEALNPERSLKHSPLFQVKLVLQNVPMQPLELTNLSLTPMVISQGVSRLDLTLLLQEEGGGIRGYIEYNTDLFEENTISRLAASFEAILQQVVMRPQVSLSDLNELLLKLEQKLLEAEAEARATSDFERFQNIKPQSVKLSTEEAIQTGYLHPGLSFPLLVQPRKSEVDLVDWGKRSSEFIERELRRHGALLFRGFNLSSASGFEQFAKNISPELVNDNGEHSREAISSNIYTPVFYPAYLRLLWHNENSFNHRWPMKIWFCCSKPANEGGETPIVDSRQVFESISPAIREQFIRKGVMYVRNYGDNFELGWQQIFQTSSKSEVERRCREDRIDFEWKDSDRLVTRSVRPAVGKHPHTGEMVWLNQAQLWHPHCLDIITRESIRSLFREEDLPRNCYYGDGSVIEDSLMNDILEVYQKLEVSFPWQKWDVLMLDNMLSAHGRTPFAGERELLVAMGEMLSYSDI
jgi:amino acid adenylation domain-containing protein